LQWKSGAAEGNAAPPLKSLTPAKDALFQETREDHLIRNGFTGEAYFGQSKNFSTAIIFLVFPESAPCPGT